MPNYADAITQSKTIFEAGLSITVYDDPPEQLPKTPCMVLDWVRGGGTWLTENTTKDTATLRAGLYVTRQVLPAASAKARPYLQLFRDTLADYRDLNDAVTAINEWRFNGPGPTNYADVEAYGIVFELDLILVQDP